MGGQILPDHHNLYLAVMTVPGSLLRGIPIPTANLYFVTERNCFVEEAQSRGSQQVRQHSETPFKDGAVAQNSRNYKRALKASDRFFGARAG